MIRRAALVGALSIVAVPVWGQGLRLTGSVLGHRVEYRMRYQGVVEEQTGTWVGGELRARLGSVVLRVGTVTGSLSGGTGVADVTRTVRSTLLEAGLQRGEWLQLLASGEARRFETDAGVTTWGLLGGTVRLTPELGFRGLRALVGVSLFPVRKTSSGAEMQAATRTEAGFVWAPSRNGLQVSLVYRFDRYDFAPSGASAARLEQFRGVMLGVGLSLGGGGGSSRVPRALPSVSAAPAVGRMAQAACRPGLELRVRPQDHTFTAVGGTLQLEAFGPVAAGAGPAGACSSCRWSSGDSITATVSSSGLVTARANGSATIAAWMPGGFCGRTTVTVAEPVVNLWAPVSYGHPRDWDGVWGSSGTDVFAVGRHQGYGAVLHWDGLQWQLRDTVANVGLAGIWGANANDVYAVGGWGTVRHLHGGSWTTELELKPDQWDVEFRDVWGSSASDVYAVGRSGIGGASIWHKMGATWAMADSLEGVPPLDGAWGTASGNVFLVGGGGTILHWNGTCANSQYTGTTPTLKGHCWRRLNSGADGALLGIWGSSGSDIWAVGAALTILHSADNGVSWTVVSPGPATSTLDLAPLTLHAVWGASPTNVYAVGEDGTILHWDGRNWSRMAMVLAPGGGPGFLTAVWGSSATDIYLVGWAGTILHGVVGTTPP